MTGYPKPAPVTVLHYHETWRNPGLWGTILRLVRNRLSLNKLGCGMIPSALRNGALAFFCGNAIDRRLSRAGLALRGGIAAIVQVVALIAAPVKMARWWATPESLK